jgi:hypothetical protein
VRILKEGLLRLARLSVHSKDEKLRELAATYVKLILRGRRRQTGGECGKVCKKAKRS